MPPQSYKGPQGPSSPVARPPRKIALIRHQDHAITVSATATTGLPPEVLVGLTDHMTYKHVTMLYGAEAFAKCGKGRMVQSEERHLYEVGETSRFLLTGAGYLPFVWNHLTQRGYEITYEDLCGRPSHPQAYEVDWAHMYERFTPRYRQEECIAAITATDGGKINAIPGFGKSAVIGAICRGFRHARIAVVTKRSQVLTSLKRELLTYTANVGQVGNGKNEKNRITLYSADSLHHLDDLVDRTDFLFADEAHELAADRYADRIGSLQVRKRFAFSGSFDARPDKADARLECLFGPEIFKLDFQEGVDHGLVVPIEVHWHNVILDDHEVTATGGSPTTKDRWDLWRNKGRNRIIAAIAHQSPDDEQVLILVKRVEHAMFLRKLLREFTVIHGDLSEEDEQFYRNNKMITDDWTPLDRKQRNRYQDQFRAGDLKKVISTAVWEVGVSFDALSVMIWGGAGSSEISSTQGPGRTSRIHAASGKQVGIVHDLLDQFSPDRASQAATRGRHYKKHKWVQRFPHDETPRRQIASARY